MIDSIRANYTNIRERIESACRSVGRNPGEVVLVAVSKTQSRDAVQAAYDLGIRDFGESRLQEALPKIEALPSDIRWHFIGTLQSNKVRKIASNFEVIHTFDNERQMEEMTKIDRVVDGLIEVNIAQETQKTGLLPNKLEHFGKKLLSCSQVRFRGLMTIGPPLEDPEGMRPCFKALHDLNRTMGGQWLSMGMSHDFEVAIQEGSTHIRIGTALFGDRR